MFYLVFRSGKSCSFYIYFWFRRGRT